MPATIGPKIGIDGEAQFRRDLQLLNENIRTLGTEMAIVTSEFAGQEKSVEALTAKNDVLARTIDSLEERLEMQNQALAASIEKYGEADARTLKWQQAVNTTVAEINKNSNAVIQNSQAIEELADAQDNASGIGGKLKSVLSSLGVTMTVDVVSASKMVLDIIVKITQAMGEAITESAAYADEILTLSTNYGISTETLQEFQYMSELTDTSMSTITGSLSKLTKNMASAKSGTGAAADAFRELGVGILESNGELRDSEAVFMDAIAALGQIENATERDALSMDIFGKSAMDLNSLIAAGRDGIKAYAEEAHAMGYVLDEDTLASLGAMDDQFQRLDRTMEAARNRIAAGFAPQLTDLSKALLDVAQAVDWEAFGRAVGGVLQFLTPLIVGVVQLVGMLAEALGTILGLIGSAGSAVIDFFTGGGGRSTANVPTLPGFAAGGVFEPNNPVLAILGDNTTEREIVAPRSEMISATMEAIQMSGGMGGNRPITIQFTGDLAQLGRVLQPVITSDTARVGAVL